jgi:hypothetical protein
MQGTQVEPGTSQFRRPWATIVPRIISTNMIRPDLSHSRLFMRAKIVVSSYPLVRGSTGSNAFRGDCIGLMSVGDVVELSHRNVEPLYEAL